jgi:hypothetical protein
MARTKTKKKHRISILMDTISNNETLFVSSALHSFRSENEKSKKESLRNVVQSEVRALHALVAFLAPFFPVPAFAAEPAAAELRSR